MDTTTGNKLIAEFMKWTVEPGMEKEDDPYYNFNNGWNMILLSDMKYHSDWNWIMPVVEKIEALGYVCNIDKSRTFISALLDNKSFYSGRVGDETKLDTLWQCVTQFIQWYNNNQTPQP